MFQRCAKNGPRFEADLLVNSRVEPGVMIGIIANHAFPILRDPADDALPDREFDVARLDLRPTNACGDCKEDLSIIGIDKRKATGFNLTIPRSSAAGFPFSLLGWRDVGA